MTRRPKRGLISQRAYARRLGVSHTAVQQAIAAGRISTVGGKIEPAGRTASGSRTQIRASPGIASQANRSTAVSWMSLLCRCA